MPGSHLIVTVHGIRTFGQWQERLEALVTAASAGTADSASADVEFVNYKYGYFSVFAFILPFTRWLVVRQFRRTLIELCNAKPRTRIDLVGHSFGTHVIAWALAGLPTDATLQVHTVILAEAFFARDSRGTL